MLILFFVVCLVGAQKYPACQNQTFSFDNSWISEHLPFTNCSLGQDTVYYTYSFPSDTVFCGPFHIWVQVYNEDTGYESTTRPLTIIDSFGMEHLDQSYTQIGYCFPPPQITFNISRNSFYLGNENSVITLRQLNEFASKNYRLLPLNYNKVEQYSITPGMEPLILVMNTSMKNEVLYKIKGHPKLTAYYVKQTDYWPNDQPTSSASSVFVLNGTGGGIIDSVANWNGAREFSELNFIKMGSANHNHMNAPALMFLMDSSDLEDLHDPQFVWPQGIYDISSGSSITLVDLDTYRKKCRYYTVHFDNISEDLEIIVYSGFPKKNIKEATVIGRYNSSQVSIMVLGCTNTIEVLRGSFRLGVDYVTIWSPGQYMLFLPPTNSTLAVKTEAKVCGNHTRIELSVYQNDDEISVSCKVDWRIVKSAQGSTMKMHKWLRNGDGGREQFNLDLTHNGTFMAGKADGVHWTNVNFGGPMTVEFQVICH